MKDLINHVLVWGADRGIHEPDLRPQFIKLTEELGEVAAGVARNKDDQIIDGVGDLLVVLINFGACFAQRLYPDSPDEQERMAKSFLESCLNQAWKEIRDRKGKTVGGVFVKEDE